MLSNEELEERLTALEKKVEQSRLMMRRPEHNHYEKLVDVVCDHDVSIRQLSEMAHPKPSGKTQQRNEDRLDALEKSALKIASETAKGL